MKIAPKRTTFLLNVIRLGVLVVDPVIGAVARPQFDDGLKTGFLP